MSDPHPLKAHHLRTFEKAAKSTSGQQWTRLQCSDFRTIKSWRRLRVGVAMLFIGPGRGPLRHCGIPTHGRSGDRTVPRRRRQGLRGDAASARVRRTAAPPKYFEEVPCCGATCIQACVTKLMATAGTSDAKGDTAVSAADTKTDLKAVSTENVGFVAPPRTTSDITEILDKQKPDPERIGKLATLSRRKPTFRFEAARSRRFLLPPRPGAPLSPRLSDSIADARLAIKTAHGADYVNVISRYEQFLYRRLREDGQAKSAIDIVNQQITAFSKTGRGRLFGLYLVMVEPTCWRGNIKASRIFLHAIARFSMKPRRGRSIASMHPASTRPSRNALRVSPRRVAATPTPRTAIARRREQLYSETVGYLSKWPSAPPAPEERERQSDLQLALEGRARWLGRTGEEGNVRRALLSRLSKVGKYHPDTATILGFFVYALQEQGRYEDAEKLELEVIDIYKGLGYGDDSGQASTPTRARQPDEHAAALRRSRPDLRTG